jgi:hypothetical protein
MVGFDEYFFEMNPAPSNTRRFPNYSKTTNQSEFWVPNFGLAQMDAKLPIQTRGASVSVPANAGKTVVLQNRTITGQNPTQPEEYNTIEEIIGLGNSGNGVKKDYISGGAGSKYSQSASNVMSDSSVTSSQVNPDNTRQTIAKAYKPATTVDTNRLSADVAKQRAADMQTLPSAKPSNTFVEATSLEDMFPSGIPTAGKPVVETPFVEADSLENLFPDIQRAVPEDLVAQQQANYQNRLADAEMAKANAMKAMNPWNQAFGVANAAVGLYGAYLGKQNLDLSRDMFKENRRLGRINVSNQVNMLEDQMRTQARAINAMGYGRSEDKAVKDLGLRRL